MTRVRSRFGTSAKAIALRTGHALSLLCMAWCAPDAHAYPMYDDGAGNGCVSCHNGFQGGNGPLHFQHRTQLGITTCNVCHPAGGGSTPVRTYWSGPGGGFGCAGCHGQDYGETSPNSGEPKATSYGLRRFHVNQGITACGSSGCHRPGSARVIPNPFPTLLGENVPPPYYKPHVQQPDEPVLERRGRHAVRCSTPSVSTTTATGWSTAGGYRLRGSGSGEHHDDHDEYDHDDDPVRLRTCSGRRLRRSRTRAVLIVTEQKTGKEKLKVSLTKLQTAVTAEPVRRPGHGQDDVQGLHLRRRQPAEG